MGGANKSIFNDEIFLFSDKLLEATDFIDIPVCIISEEISLS